MRPFFSFYGAKFNSIKHYPQPRHKTIIEPFAGSASYSVHYYTHNVILYDIDPVICAIWQYLIKVTPEELRKLPIDFEHTDELITTCWEARCLIGFWLQPVSSRTCYVKSTWSDGKLDHKSVLFWSKWTIERLCNQIPYIRHWKIFNKSYKDIDYNDSNITWFVDPPYNGQSGRKYKYNQIDYQYLANWCRERKGQLIVCENDGADWLPFQLLGSFQAVRGITHEMIYMQNCETPNLEEGCWKV